MTAFDEDVLSLSDRIMRSVPAHDPIAVSEEATNAAAIKRLGEMRLLALSPDGIIGMTELGQRVLIGLLFAAHAGARYQPSVQQALIEASVVAMQIVPFEAVPEELRQEMETLLARKSAGE